MLPDLDLAYLDPDISHLISPDSDLPPLISFPIQTLMSRTWIVPI